MATFNQTNQALSTTTKGGQSYKILGDGMYLQMKRLCPSNHKSGVFRHLFLFFRKIHIILKEPLFILRALSRSDNLQVKPVFIILSFL